jgi:hypothetical protein
MLLHHHQSQDGHPLTTDATSHRLVTSAPVIQLSPVALGQIVSWSDRNDEPFSLRQYVASRVKSMADRLRVQLDEAKGEYVPRVTELGDKALAEVVCERLRRDAEQAGAAPLVIMGVGTFSNQQLIHHVRDRTEVGFMLLSSEQRNIDVLEGLIEAGKVNYIDAY